MAETDSGKKGVMTKWIKMEDAGNELLRGVQLAGVDNSGELLISVVLQGRHEIRLNFSFETVDELIKVLKINAKY